MISGWIDRPSLRRSQGYGYLGPFTAYARHGGIGLAYGRRWGVRFYVETARHNGFSLSGRVNLAVG